MRFMNHAKTAILLGGLIGVLMMAAHLLGYGGGGVVFAFVLGSIGVLISFFFSDKIAIAAMRGQQVTRDDIPWLYDMVENLAARAGLPMPKLYICPQQAPNAFATGRSPKKAAVAITQGMMQSFPREEIEGVMAHELAHVKNRDTLIQSVAAMVGGAVSMLAYFALFMGGRRDSPLGIVGPIAVFILAPIAAGLIQAAISRQREFIADSYGGEVAGDPRKLANALRRLQSLNERVPMQVNPAFNQMFIMEPLAARDMAQLFSTHPKTEERIARLLEQAGERR